MYKRQIVENDIKRIIAYSTISQLSFIFLGLSSGTMIGVAGGLLYILMHSLAKVDPVSYTHLVMVLTGSCGAEKF